VIGLIGDISEPTEGEQDRNLPFKIKRSTVILIELLREAQHSLARKRFGKLIEEALN